jgi:hypothetical protein
MSNSTYFSQACPTCGRRLMIRVEYLGKRVACQHCQGQFMARDSASIRCDCPEDSCELLRRADELLQSSVQHKANLPTQHPR